MKKQILFIIVIVVLGITSCHNKSSYKTKHEQTALVAKDTLFDKNTMKKLIDSIQWFGQSSIKIIANNKVIYIDPYNVS